MSANLISSILVEEEGDLTEDRVTYASHYEIYIRAMEKIGANTNQIKTLLVLLKSGEPIESALELINIRPATKNFILSTFSFFELESYELAAAFVYGREDITAAMFLPILRRLDRNDYFLQAGIVDFGANA